MDSTTGGDPNDEFARWLAEAARAEQANAPAPATPPAPAAPPPQAAPPAQGPAPATPGVTDPGPPTLPYEPQLGGPQVARSSFQAPAAPVAPAAPLPQNDGLLPPAFPPAAQPAPAQPAPPAFPPAAPTAPPPAFPPAATPSWAPGYTAPAGAPPAPDAPPAFPQPGGSPQPTGPQQPQVTPQPDGTGTPFFPSAGAPAAPPPAAPAPFPVAPAYEPPAPPPQAFEQAPPQAFPPQVPEAPAFPPQVSPQPADSQLPAPTAAPAFPPLVPDAAEAAGAPASDPFGPLFAAEDDTAARLAAAAPPSAAPLISPDAGAAVADDDPMKSLFGLHTEEQPAIADPLPSSTLEPTPEPAPAGQWPQLPTHQPEQQLSHQPEPAFAAQTAPAASGASAASGSYSLTMPAGRPPADDDPTAGTQFFGGGTGEWDESPDLDRTTTGERIAFVLAFLVPPAGLITSIVAAVQSSRERGWVHGFVRAALVISLVMTVVAGFAGAFFYKQLEDARKHDALVASSTQFCATIADRPEMIEPPAFGFPAPAATIADTLAAIQEYVDRWNALAAVSPSGIRPDVSRVADSASDILDTISDTRIVNNDENVAVMSSVAESTNIVGWAETYCG